MSIFLNTKSKFFALLFLVSFFVLCLSTNAEAQKQNLDATTVRLLFKKAVYDKQAAERLRGLLLGEKGESPVLLACRGANEAVMAKHAFNPYHKIKYVSTGLSMLGEAAKKDPQNIEIRYLRIAVESQIPSFLGMSAHLEEDRRIILNHLSKTGRIVPGSLEDDVYKMMSKFGLLR